MTVRGLERIERVKAKERMEAGTELDPSSNLRQGKTAQIVAQETGFGSEGSYGKAKYIDDNADKETIEKLNEEKFPCLL